MDVGVVADDVREGVKRVLRGAVVDVLNGNDVLDTSKSQLFNNNSEAADLFALVHDFLQELQLTGTASVLGVELDREKEGSYLVEKRRSRTKGYLINLVRERLRSIRKQERLKIEMSSAEDDVYTSDANESSSSDYADDAFAEESETTTRGSLPASKSIVEEDEVDDAYSDDDFDEEEGEEEDDNNNDDDDDANDVLENKSADKDEAKESSVPEIDPDEMSIGELIAGGGFATVHNARWRRRKVAVKMLFDPKISARMIADFKREVSAMARAGGHPNIVQIVAACTSRPKLCLVMERCQTTVFHLLHLSDVSPTDAQLASFAVDLAAAVEHLHSLDPPMCHRDIKTLNLLLDRALAPGQGVVPGTRIKLCDFGLADAPSDGTATPQYSPPEQLRGGRVTTAGDVYSSAIVVWELFTGRVPYDGFDQRDVKSRVVKGARPEIPRIGFPQALRELLPLCWSKSPALRPTAREVRKALKRFSAECAREAEASNRLKNSTRFDDLDDDLFASLGSGGSKRR